MLCIGNTSKYRLRIIAACVSEGIVTRCYFPADLVWRVLIRSGLVTFYDKTNILEAKLEKTFKSHCWECNIHCGILIKVSDNKVIKIEGDPVHPLNKFKPNPSKLCLRGHYRAITETYKPNRMLYPQKRIGERGEGKWKRISWQEALTEISDRIGDIKGKYGPLAICGGTHHFHYNKFSVAAMLLLRSLGSPNMIDTSDICGSPARVAADLTTKGAVLGMPKYSSDVTILNTKCILNIGLNPTVSSEPHWYYLLEAKRRGAKFIVIDPRRIQAAKKADIYLQIKPGTDVALGLAILNITIAENLYDKDFINKWCYGFEALKERVKDCTPYWAEKITNLPSERILEVARTFAKNKPGVVWAMSGFNHSINAIQCHRTFLCLQAILGNIDIPGGQVFPKPFPGFISNIMFAHDREFRLPKEVEAKKLGANQFPIYIGPEGFYSGVHPPTAFRAMYMGEPYPVKAFINFGFNPIASRQNTRFIWEALKKLDLFVISETGMTPTAELADFILPPATTLELNLFQPDYFYHGLPVGQKVVEPPADCWEDMKIAIELKKALKERNLIEQDFLPWDNPEEFDEYVLKGTGYSFSDLKKEGMIYFSTSYKSYEKEGFKTPTGKVELYSTTLDKFGYDPLPHYSTPREGELKPALAKRYPLLLMQRREYIYYGNVGRDHDWARKKVPFPVAEIHKTVAEERKIHDGDWIFIETPLGKCKMKAKVRNDIYWEVVCVPYGWWYPEQPGPEHGAWEPSVNSIISDEPPYEPVVGNPITNNLVCEVRKAESRKRSRISA